MTADRRAKEVIRVTEWAEIRHLHLVEGVGKKALARWFGRDVKTIRRAIENEVAPEQRHSPPRGRRLDAHREEIEQFLRADRKITAKRVWALLEPRTGPITRRAVRRYVAEVRTDLFGNHAFVHRTHLPGDLMEIDFGKSWARILGKRMRVHFFVATLPASNAYFARVYRIEKLECWLDGICEAFRWAGGVPHRLVMDNTSVAVKRVLKGAEREETKAFHAFRGAFPVGVDYCAPASGWEKGSAETGVKYVRNNGFRPMPSVDRFEDLNVQLMAELDRDLDRRHLPDGRTAREAFLAERAHLRPLPAHWPEACRVETRVANKFGHVRHQRSTYSVPTRYAHRPIVVKAYPDRIELAVDADIVARHARSFQPGTFVLDPRHVLPLLEEKWRAAGEATALGEGFLPPVFNDLRRALNERTRRADLEWVRVLLLLEDHPMEILVEAVREALSCGSPRLETIRWLLRPTDAELPVGLVPIADDHLAGVDIAEPELALYDALCEVPS